MSSNNLEDLPLHKLLDHPILGMDEETLRNFITHLRNLRTTSSSFGKQLRQEAKALEEANPTNTTKARSKEDILNDYL